MHPIILILLLAFLTLVGFAVGAAMGSRNHEKLPSRDRQELNARRQFMNDRINEAAEHVALGDTFASIYLDHNREFYRNHIEKGSR